ncbi:MAG: UDP-N-acetylmuramoyl-L-alanyl-D-glutamate--2,6-diaminopimelate ligase [Ignavibacteria bacterium]|nr:UDP-N-acetylmuramoyl-L-alanyl-D-glutamate--2,6-diaminopimelate ligase [Ignavibacteria bacterium]
MVLEKVLEGVVVSKMVHKEPWQGSHSLGVTVEGISHDSRRVGPRQIYVAIKGEKADGHQYIQEAIRRGAVAVVMEDDGALADPFFTHEGVVKIVVGDARKAMAELARNFYGNPSQKLVLVGITGTNGKTTTAHLVRSILEANGRKVGLLGTMGHHDGVRAVPATHTTPESTEVNRLLAGMVENGCQAVVMEVSSHALAMQRVHGLKFSGAVFTNLTQDHLDFHGSMEVYGATKKKLFDALDQGAVAATNIDDPFGERIISESAARKLTYGAAQGADVRTMNTTTSFVGTGVTLVYQGRSTEVRSPLAGLFNASNISAACAVSMGLGVAEPEIIKGVAALQSVRGRFETIRGKPGWTAVVDYAHTPDALERVLHSIRDLNSGGRVITVFGCGGDRDRGKRPMMGEIASRLSDVTILTSDNPRSEDPSGIIRDIREGVQPGAQVHEEVDRRKAIAQALEGAQAGDVVLIAGKGHETYQIIGDVRTELDDREEVRKFLRDRKWN